VNPKAAVFQRRFSPIIILTTRRATAGRLKELPAVAAEVKVCGAKEINFPRGALLRCAGNGGSKRLLCEGGGELNDALFHAGLVNQLHLTVCPRFSAGRNAPTIADGWVQAAWRGDAPGTSSQRGGRGLNVPRVPCPEETALTKNPRRVVVSPHSRLKEGRARFWDVWR